MLCSGCGMAVALINLYQLWLLAQDLGKTEPIKILEGVVGGQGCCEAHSQGAICCLWLLGRKSHVFFFGDVAALVDHSTTIHTQAALIGFSK